MHGSLAMLTLALALTLAAENELPPPPPPPLVPVEPARPPLAPVLPYAPPPEPRAPAAAVSEEDEVTTFSSRRVALTAAVAGGTGAVLVGGAAALLMLDRSGSAISPLIAIASLPLSLFLGTGLGYMVHSRMGGQGSWSSHLAGGAIGGGIALIGATAAFSSQRGTPSIPIVAALVIGAGALFGAGSALFGELSNYNTLRERGLVFSLVPARDGAMAMAGMRF